MQIKLKRRMTSQSKHCDDGPTPEELLPSGHPVENDSIQLQTVHAKGKDLLYISESVRNKSQISDRIRI